MWQRIIMIFEIPFLKEKFIPLLSPQSKNHIKADFRVTLWRYKHKAMISLLVEILVTVTQSC